MYCQGYVYSQMWLNLLVDDHVTTSSQNWKEIRLYKLLGSDELTSIEILNPNGFGIN
jgi:hypothetical protein